MSDDGKNYDSEMDSEDEEEMTPIKIKSKPNLDEYYDEEMKIDGDDEDEEDPENEDEDEGNIELVEKDEILKEVLPDIDDDDDDDDNDNEDYLQKFDENISKKIISDYHPEMQQLNYEEVESLSTVVRSDTGVIIDVLHRTLPFLTKYEKARILGERAKQLNAGAKPFVEVEDNILDGYLIALKELENKKIPFIIKRPLPNGGCEYWRLRDLEIIS